MSADARPGSGGFVHEAAVYDSDEELLAVVVPHLQAGLAADEPTFAALTAREGALVRSALGERSSGVQFWPGLAGTSPPAVVKQVTTLAGALAAGGAERARVVNTVPHPGLGAPWDGWCRYEAAINELLAALPLWGLCLYDRRLTGDEVLGDVERTHPRLTAEGTHRPNDHYADPRRFILSMSAPPDPLEAEPPAVELVGPTPAASRQAVRSAAGRTLLGLQDVEDLVFATSEAVTNATVHGRPPVSLRAWTTAHRVVVTVHDRGEGPRDPYAGLVPAAPHPDGGGMGLWVMHQLLPVSYTRGDGFTIRVTAGALPDR